jgi:hypothetical protein
MARISLRAAKRTASTALRAWSVYVQRPNDSKDKSLIVPLLAG